MSKRTAALNLEWEQDGDDYVAQLPAIPGYPEMHDEESLVYVAPVGDGYTFWMEIAVLKSEFIKLTDLNFNLPNAKTADEMMQEVDTLTVQDILDALSAVGCGPIDATASRKATRRIASMNLDWEPGDPGKDWEAPLPYIPGYPCADGFSDYVEVADLSGLEGTGWCFTMYLSLQNEDVNLYNEDFGIPYTDTAEEMMDIIENLNPQDIASVLEDFGFAPEDGTTAGRHAMRRKADMNLDWEQDDVAGSWFAELPAIPGYPCYPYANDLYHSVQVADQSGLEGTDWAFYMYLNLKNEYVDLYNEDFGIPDTDTAEEMMDIVENLDPQDIADVLAENGYIPDED